MDNVDPVKQMKAPRRPTPNESAAFCTTAQSTMNRPTVMYLNPLPTAMVSWEDISAEAACCHIKWNHIKEQVLRKSQYIYIYIYIKSYNHIITYIYMVSCSVFLPPSCYGRLAFIWRIENIQDLPGAARRLLDSERFEGVPVSSFQERLCTLWQRGKNI